MMRVWWGQIRSVIRLEMKKTFFAKRGLWIYVLALLPIVLFIGHAVVDARLRDRSAQIVAQEEKPLTDRDLLAIKPGMTRQEVVALLGKPPIHFQWKERRPSGQDSFVDVPHENYCLLYTSPSPRD